MCADILHILIKVDISKITRPIYFMILSLFPIGFYLEFVNKSVNDDVKPSDTE